jgi:hypothetical protein
MNESPEEISVNQTLYLKQQIKEKGNASLWKYFTNLKTVRLVIIDSIQGRRLDHIYFFTKNNLKMLADLFKLGSLYQILEPAFRAVEYQANERGMTEVLKKHLYRTEYDSEKKELFISPIYKEDYEFQWGLTDYENTTVLDIGADIGSTAYFFAKNGAKQIIAVEGSKKLFNQLKLNVNLRKVVPIFLYITTPADIEKLIKKWKPDIIKMDIEGAEINLLQIRDLIFQDIPKLMIEIHNKDLLELFIQKCMINNFIVIRFSSHLRGENKPPYIAHAIHAK